MKLVALFLLLGGVSGKRVLSNNDLDEYWQEFKKVYEKSYSTSEEHDRREIWEKNVDGIIQHNLKADMGKHTYRQGLNEHSDMDYREVLSKMTGLRSDALIINGSLWIPPSNVTIPDRVDWRDDELVTTVQDQGGSLAECPCGSSTACRCGTGTCPCGSRAECPCGSSTACQCGTSSCPCGSRAECPCGSSTACRCGTGKCPCGSRAECPCGSSTACQCGTSSCPCGLRAECPCGSSTACRCGTGKCPCGSRAECPCGSSTVCRWGTSSCPFGSRAECPWGSSAAFADGLSAVGPFGLLSSCPCGRSSACPCGSSASCPCGSAKCRCGQSSSCPCGSSASCPCGSAECRCGQSSSCPCGSSASCPCGSAECPWGTSSSCPWRLSAAREQQLTEKYQFLKKGDGANCTGFVVIPSGDEEVLKQAVATVGPISVAIDSTGPGFGSYKNGVYDEPTCRTDVQNHAVLIVGYGTLDGVDYWLVKNSWGETWGMKGYIMMSRNKDNQCGIATKASYPLV